MANEKDIVYERDYRELHKLFMEHTYSKEQHEAFTLAQNSGVFKAIHDRMCELPHILNLKAKEAYDDCFVMLEQYAARMGGRICGEVSYEVFEAHIYLDLPFHEFTPDRMEELKFIANNACSVCFTAIEDNMIRLSIRFPYFEKVGEVNSIIDEEFIKCPEICENLENIEHDEVKQILADPLLVAMIEPQAEKAGMTVEDYVKSLNTVINKNPDELMELLNEILKDRHEGFSQED